ncbi:RNA endoribonuclease [Glugoides intestinalis]
MFKISIVPDTNILISHLDIVKMLYVSGLPVPYTLNFSKTVLDELDNLKTRKVEARNAIRFIESISTSLKTEIEGKIDDRKLDIVIDGPDQIEPKNNDDRILNYCFQLENPLLLTNDKAFYLKCQSFNIKALIVEKVQESDFIEELLKEFEIENTSMKNEYNQCYIKHIKELIRITIGPVISQILYREVGENVDMAFRSSFSLEEELEFVIKNFILFKNFLPGKSQDIIKDFLKAVKEEDKKKIKGLVHPICMLFRKTFPEDRL